MLSEVLRHSQSPHREEQPQSQIHSCKKINRKADETLQRVEISGGKIITVQKFRSLQELPTNKETSQQTQNLSLVPKAATI